MIRIEFAESNPSRRSEQPQKQRQEKRPALLKRIFGTRDTRKPQIAAKCEKQAHCPSLAEQEMLIV
jgi:hypothetical protein